MHHITKRKLAKKKAHCSHSVRFRHNYIAKIWRERSDSSISSAENTHVKRFTHVHIQQQIDIEKRMLCYLIAIIIVRLLMKSRSHHTSYWLNKRLHTLTAAHVLHEIIWLRARQESHKKNVAKRFPFFICKLGMVQATKGFVGKSSKIEATHTLNTMCIQ